MKNLKNLPLLVRNKSDTGNMKVGERGGGGEGGTELNFVMRLLPATQKRGELLLPTFLPNIILCSFKFPNGPLKKNNGLYYKNSFIFRTD
jgi:hypothetical protein